MNAIWPVRRQCKSEFPVTSDGVSWCPPYTDPPITRADSAVVVIDLPFGQTFRAFSPITRVLFHIYALTWLALDECRAVLFYEFKSPNTAPAFVTHPYWRTKLSHAAENLSEESSLRS